MELGIKNHYKYMILIIKILLLTIGLIKGRKYYLEPFYNFVENYYSTRIEVIGRENIPKDSGYVIISNHNFTTEVAIIKNVVRNEFTTIAAKNFLNRFLKISDDLIFLYDKNDDNIIESGKYIKRKIYEITKNKRNVLIFPEGKYSTINKGLYPFKKGLFHLCYIKNIPILPIIICIKKNKIIAFLNLDSKIKVKIFKMLYPNDFINFDEYYNYIYNKMNKYIKNYINDPNVKCSILI